MTHFIFDANDTVTCQGEPFWMTVIEVNPATGCCSCRFGANGNYAGTFGQNELEFYGGHEFMGQRQDPAAIIHSA